MTSMADLLRHLLVSSELSGRNALPEHTLRCTLSGKRILMDEAELSAVTGEPVASTLLKTCAMTGRRAEPEHLERCAFSGAEVLNTVLAVSEVSGKRYRIDQHLRSVVVRQSRAQTRISVLSRDTPANDAPGGPEM